MQTYYWNLVTQYKYDLFLLDEHYSSSIVINRIVSMFLAITSSVSIAAWAIWNEYNFLWAFLIALSHVINAVKEFLPYKKRIEAIADLKSKLSPIYNEMEYKWYDVQHGKLTEDEINELIYNFKMKRDKISLQALAADHLPRNKRLEESAEKMKNDYFKKFFMEEI